MTFFGALKRIFAIALLLTISLETFGVSSVEAQPLFLRPPFNVKPDGSYYRLTSFFDHWRPNYTYDGRMVIYNGEDVANGNPYDYDGHSGYDWAMDEGTNILAAADGIVQNVRVASIGYGIEVCIKHPNGYSTRYGHLNISLVSINSIVLEGQVIGRSGNTGNSSGPHLHFGLYYGTFCDNSEATATDPFGWTGNYPDPLTNFPIAGQGKTASCSFRSALQDPISCFDIIYEDKGRGFSTSGTWNEDVWGNGYHRYYRFNSNGNEYAAWQFTVSSITPAEVFGWIPDTYANTNNATYGIWTVNGWRYIHINQQVNPNRWVSLGTYYFYPDPINNYVVLSANTGEGVGSKYISVDGIKFRTYHTNAPLIMKQCTDYDEYMMNGNFENGLNWWYTFRSPNNGISFLQSRAGGGHAVKLGGSVSMSDIIDQGLSPIPSGPCPVTLTYEIWVHSTEPSTTTRHDQMNVVFEQNGIFVLQTIDNTSLRDTSIFYSIDIRQFKGNGGYIRFNSLNDYSNPTEFWIDNISIQIFHD